MLLLSRDDIKKVVTMRDIIEADKVAFKMVVDGTIDVPLRTGIPAPAHDAMLLFMPSYAAAEETAAIKIISVFPHNPQEGLEACPAQVLLLDGRTGYIIAMLDGNTVTQMRTGAASGAAFDLLAKKDCRIGGLIGTGGQAAAQLEAMLCARDLEEVRIYSRNAERCRAFVEQMRVELADYGVRFVAAESSDECVVDADLLITVTSASDPVFDGTKVKKVNTLNIDGKTKRRGMTFGKTSKSKKAVVTLAEDSKDIEIFEGL